MAILSNIPRVYGQGNRVGEGTDNVSRKGVVVRGCLHSHRAQNLLYGRMIYSFRSYGNLIGVRMSAQCCVKYRNGTGLGCRSSRVGTLSLTRRTRQKGGSRAVSEDVSSQDGILEHQDGGRAMLSLAECQQMLPLHAGNVYMNVPEKVTCAADLVAWLDSDAERGISKDSGWSPEERMAMYGSNALEPPTSPSFLDLVLDALNEFTVLVLLGAGGASMVLELWLAGKEHRDANLIESVSILAAVAVVVLVSAGNNWQKDQQFKALQEVQSKENVRAIRNGQEMSLPVESVVVGDLLIVETGDILCADGVLIQGYDVKVDESHLTGESDEVEKNAGGAQAMYSGSKVLTGVGRMIVTSVGSQSQSGMIADMVVGNEGAGEKGIAVKEETLLQKKLATYASFIGKLGLGASVLTTAIMAAKFSYEQFVVQGVPWSYDYLEQYLEFFITGVTILVVAIPEGLPLAVTISLAFSVMKMLEDNNLVRHLSAAETMGTATVICTDKTGTLTQNKMAVKKFWMGGDVIMLPSPERSASESSSDLSDIEDLFSYMDRDVRNLVCEGIALNSTASIKQGRGKGAKPNGNKTELALLELAEKMGGGLKCSLDQKRCQSDAYDAFVIGQCPFTSERKRMSSVVLLKSFDDNEPSKVRLFVKGAAEVVLRSCSRWINFDGSINDVTDQGKEGILDRVHGDGLRLLCLAYKDLDIQLSEEEMALCNYSNSPKVLFNNDEIQKMETDLTVIAVAGISDPLRPEVVGAIKNCKKGGISVRMFTGDNPITAESIAVSCGILEQEHGPLAVMESKDFIQRIVDSDDKVDGQKFVANWQEMRVLARCSPTDKFTIVEALKEYTDEIVAVTGDGTNDAPALRSANVGFAMNDGTQIAKQAADIILVDNNFASTVSAALWGRNVYANISRFLQFQLTVNLVAVATAAGGAITAAESPLTAVQMLWVNLIMDSLASLALATGTPDPSLLDEKPYSKDYNFVDLNGPLPKHILGQAAFQLAIMAWLLGPGPDLLDIPRHVVGMGPSVHHTLVFNTFVMMQLFNQVNARQIKDSNSILTSLGNARLFKWVLGGELVLQGLIVQFGGPVFATVPLDSAQWATCIGFGASSLLLRELLRNLKSNV